MRNQKIKIIGTGLSGLIGTRVIELLSKTYDFENLSLETGVDITDRNKLFSVIKKSPSTIILHMAAITDVDACEREKNKKKESLCWKVNVEGTWNIAEAAIKFKKKIIYVSTDFVFDGESPYFTEKSHPKPINWYGKTKHEAEKLIREAGSENLIIRPAFPYRANFKKEDLVRFFLNRLRSGVKIRAIDDWFITPTFIDDFAYALDKLIENNEKGIFHVVGGSSHTPFEMTTIITQVFGLDKTLIEAVKLKDLFIGKANRPRKIIIKNERLKAMGITMRTFNEGLKEIKKQLILIRN